MTLPFPHPSAPPAISRDIPSAMAGTRCGCNHGNRTGSSHPATYVLQIGALRTVACVSAAASFAAEHRLAFPLTSSTPPERP